jgi:hypothetical protein
MCSEIHTGQGRLKAAHVALHATPPVGPLIGS